MASGDEMLPNPYLVAWLRTFAAAPIRKRCLVAGCGLAAARTLPGWARIDRRSGFPE